MHVLIVGGGIGGLMLGLMLERANIGYEILERSPGQRPLGSAISLGGTVLRVFEQLGLLEDIQRISRPAGRLQLLKEDLAVMGHLDLKHFKEWYGYHTVVMARPDLHDLLINRIPAAKLHMGKRVLSSSQSEDGVLVRCSDGSSYSGDICVGCDGAYSSVRQLLHKKMKEEGRLPKSDSKPLKFDQNCVVGITNELSPEKYPALKGDTCTMYGIMGRGKPYIMWLVPIVGNRFAWSIGGRLLESELGKDNVRSFSFAEWWPGLSAEVSDLVRDYALPDLNDSSQSSTTTGDSFSTMSDGHSFHSKSTRSSHSSQADDTTSYQPSTTTTTTTSSSTNPPIVPPRRKRTSPPAKPGTVAEIIDATPEDRISKVMLESKFFKAWYYERTVLLGDACHKVLPFAGQGAVQAILDGISLANALYDMKTNSMNDITKAFKRYTNERMPMCKSAVRGSHALGKFLDIQGPIPQFIRKYSFNHVPSWLLRLSSDKLHHHRPQLTYLPMVPDRGTASAQVQAYSPKYLKCLEEDRKAFQNRHTLLVTKSAPSFSPTLNISTTTTTTTPATTTSHLDNDTKMRVVGRAPFEPEVEHVGDLLVPVHHEPRRGSHSSSSSKHRSRSLVSQRSTVNLSLISSEIPPPLPKEAAPRHHPDIYIQLHPESKAGVASVGGISASASTSSSPCSTPTSSTFSLSGHGTLQSESGGMARQPRPRRRTLTSQNGKSLPCSRTSSGERVHAVAI